LPEPATPWITRWPSPRLRASCSCCRVHDPHQVGQRVGIRRVRLRRSEQAELRAHAHLGEQDPAHPVDLRQREYAAHQRREHAPQPALEVLGVDAVGHLVGTYDAVRIDRRVQPRALELPPRDVREDCAVAPREAQRALGAAFGRHELRITRQRIDHLVRVVAGLLDRVDDGLRLAARHDLPGLLVGLGDGLEAPVLHLQDQQPAARVQHDEIGMRLSGADRHVVPDEVVVVELLFQPLGQPALALRHARDTGAEGRDQGGHARWRGAAHRRAGVDLM
jgi:hypothetical protein